MRPTPDPRAEAGRTHGSGNNGAFLLKRGNAKLRVVASDGCGWEHVSVSLATRCPTWEEMCYVKDLFFKPAEAVVQFHPAESQYVNFHPFCLHLWRPTEASIPTPPTYLVGPMEAAS